MEHHTQRQIQGPLDRKAAGKTGRSRRSRRPRQPILPIIIIIILGAELLFLGAGLLAVQMDGGGNPVARFGRPGGENAAGGAVWMDPPDAEPPDTGYNLDTAVGDWRLRLVNPWNPLPADDTVTLTQLARGQAVDERCYPDLQAMMDSCCAAGLDPLICSSYRSQETQEELYENKVARLMAQGYEESAAREAAGLEVAVPGTSEHQTGLAVDIVDLSNQNLDESQADTPVQQWLMENSWKYGFILRYPEGKREQTGILYEPWHYRYVGREAAEEIHLQGLCLEEYLLQRSKF